MVPNEVFESLFLRIFDPLEPASFTWLLLPQLSSSAKDLLGEFSLLILELVEFELDAELPLDLLFCNKVDSLGVPKGEGDGKAHLLCAAVVCLLLVVGTTGKFGKVKPKPLLIVFGVSEPKVDGKSVSEVLSTEGKWNFGRFDRRFGEGEQMIGEEGESIAIVVIIYRIF